MAKLSDFVTWKKAAFAALTPARRLRVLYEIKAQVMELIRSEEAGASALTAEERSARSSASGTVLNRDIDVTFEEEAQAVRG